MRRVVNRKVTGRGLLARIVGALPPFVAGLILSATKPAGLHAASIDHSNFPDAGFEIPAEIIARLPDPPEQADFLPFDNDDAAVGKLLFYDKILSGNRNISCGTCHHPQLGTSDGLSLGIGEGGRGVGPQRLDGAGKDQILKRIPRNSTALWNLGAGDLQTLFLDGRLSVSDLYQNGFNSPAEEWLPAGLDNLLAAQALFPMVSQFEMAGNLNENEIIGAVHDRIDAAWPLIAGRVSEIDDYANHFIRHKSHIESAGDISIVDIGNAIGAFINAEWRRINSPFDHFLRGDDNALLAQQKRGLALFYGKAECDRCHSGPWLSDQRFHALGLPAFGPGRTRQYDLIARDPGRLAETDRLHDAYAFRTPMLRNVALTAPYGHNGAYDTLAGIIRHHIEPGKMRAAWQPAQAVLPDIPSLNRTDLLIQRNRLEMQRQRSAALTRISPPLTDPEISALVSFLEALTDSSVPLSDVPAAVPSGLPVDHYPESAVDTSGHTSTLSTKTTRRNTR